MVMMKEFVPYNEALELKKLGFDEPCFGYYEPNGDFNYIEKDIIKDFPYLAKNSEWQDLVASPTLSQAFRFFREKYNLHSEILLDQTTQPKYCFEIHKYEDFGNYEEIKIDEWFLYRTYEEAELECIKHLIKVVQR
jgi:hypothetical protein